jgi:hypothetical protein
MHIFCCIRGFLPTSTQAFLCASILARESRRTILGFGRYRQCSAESYINLSASVLINQTFDDRKVGAVVAFESSFSITDLRQFEPRLHPHNASRWAISARSAAMIATVASPVSNAEILVRSRRTDRIVREEHEQECLLRHLRARDPVMEHRGRPERGLRLSIDLIHSGSRKMQSMGHQYSIIHELKPFACFLELSN